MFYLAFSRSNLPIVLHSNAGQAEISQQEVAEAIPINAINGTNTIALKTSGHN
jgi:hypothetical protein